MLNKLKTDLLRINVTIELNHFNPLFSDFELKYKEAMIGNGWIWENKAEIIGFMGWGTPAFNGKKCWTKNSGSLPHEDFEKVINLFQFAISDDYYWYSPPTNNQLAGYSCAPLSNPIKLIKDIELFINNNLDSKVFLEGGYKWDWPE